MRNAFEHVLLKLKLLMITRKCRKSRGRFKTNKSHLILCTPHRKAYEQTWWIVKLVTSVDLSSENQAIFILTLFILLFSVISATTHLVSKYVLRHPSLSEACHSWRNANLVPRVSHLAVAWNKRIWRECIWEAHCLVCKGIWNWIGHFSALFVISPLRRVLSS